MILDPLKLYNNSGELLKKRTIKGYGQVLFSPYFPTRYYKNDVSYAGKIIEYVKSKDTLRIFSYGESSAAGSPWGHPASFSRFINDELNRIKRSGKVEVMNFGIGGIGSTRVLILVKETVKYHPDVLLIYCGHNECYDNYQYLTIVKSRFNRLRHLIRDRLYIIRLGHLLIDRFMVRDVPKIDLLHYESRPFSQNEKYDKKDRDFFASQYKRNMQEIANIAFRNNIPVVFISQPCNFFYEPTYEITDKAIADMLEKAKNLINEHKYQEAGKYIDFILLSDREAATAYYYKGLICLKNQEYSKAKNAFLDSIEYDQKPQRATEEYRSILSSLSNPLKGIYFVDAKTRFYEYLNDGQIDGRLIIDTVHPTVEGQKIIAQAILEDYFMKYGVRGDLFDYAKYNPDAIWLNNIDPIFYFNICRRYYDTQNVDDCIKNAMIKLNDNLKQQRRISRNVWELLFYKGLLLKSAGDVKAGLRFFSRSMAIYPSCSLKANLTGGDISSGESFTQSEDVAYNRVFDKQANNLISEGSFERWRSKEAEVPERWSAGGTVIKEAKNVKDGIYAAKLVSAGESSYLYYDLPNTIVNSLQGMDVTLSCWVKSSIGDRKVYAQINDGIESSNAFYSGSGDWELLTVTYRIDGSAFRIRVLLEIDGKGLAYFDDAVLVEASYPVAGGV
jgi:lysophospholipase L1-like esterase